MATEALEGQQLAANRKKQAFFFPLLFIRAAQMRGDYHSLFLQLTGAALQKQLFFPYAPSAG